MVVAHILVQTPLEEQEQQIKDMLVAYHIPLVMVVAVVAVVPVVLDQIVQQIQIIQAVMVVLV